MNVLIDINCDLGEDPQRIASGADVGLLDHVTSVNLACGGHAGSADTLRALIPEAMRRGIHVGAHPSYPDPQNFGRVSLALPERELEKSVTSQLRLIERIANDAGCRIRHVKPHGALYHDVCRAAPLAAMLARAAQAAFGTEAVLVAQVGAAALELWRKSGWRIAAEAFADRRYRADGSLVPRSDPLALIDSPRAAAAQGLQIACGRGVTSVDGGIIPIRADTICIHSDTPNSLAIAAAVREALSPSA